VFCGSQKLKKMSYTNTKSVGFDQNERSPLVLIDVKTLKSILGDVVENALQASKAYDINLMKGESVNAEAGLMDMQEVIRFLKVSKVTIHNWKKSGIITSHKMGRKLYFKRSELMNAIKRQRYSIESI
jgi:excisionase family DNA binding protein